MKKLYAHKAQGIGKEELESVTIELSTEMPMLPYAEPIERSCEIFDRDAQVLMDALCSTLPGGTLDRLIGKLLMKRATAFIVPLFEKEKA